MCVLLCVVTSSDALQIPDAEVKAPKRRKGGHPGLSATRSADEAAAHAIKMRQLPAAEKAKVRPDFVVCCAGVPSSDALQEARRAERTEAQEQDRKKEREERIVRPDCVLCFARRD